SQRFSALAEQATSGNFSQASQFLPQLEREIHTGTPATPVAAAFSSTVNDSLRTSAQAHGGTPGSSVEAPINRTNASTVPAFFSPPAKFTPADIGMAPVPVPNNDVTCPAPAPFPPVEASGPDQSEPSLTGSAAKSSVRTNPDAQVRLPVRSKKKRPVSVRSLLDRARLVGLEKAEKVRVKPKKADLKPQLRTTTEELTLELKRSRMPAVISFVLTGFLLLILAFRQMEFFEDVPIPPIIASIAETNEETEEAVPIEPPPVETGEQMEQPVEEIAENPEPLPEPVAEPEPTPEPEPEIQVADAVLPESPNGTAPSSPVPKDGSNAGDTDNRSEAGRKVLLEKYGGTVASETAVGFALEWLAARQRSNGTWDFIDVGPCTQKGSVNNPIGGTAYALLPFLAAGQTHKEGKYRQQVQAGLAFLTTIGVAVPAGYDLRGVINKVDDDTEPNYAYYVHGAATLALCEAYGMTRDRKLKQAAEGAVLFLVNSQNPRSGGWRYNPQEGGSTSATAIQVMALKAAEKAGIRIPAGTWKGVSSYLDSVSVDGEGRYGYEAEKKTYAMSVTSMALLSRMYLGWGRNDGDLRAGIALISKSAASENYYTNYFATQVMKNWGGPEWDRWNVRIREDLIARQETDGPARGSWAARDRADYSRSGGRLLTTCLATLTLQVYYRNKPLLDEYPSLALPQNPALVAPVDPP
ncbi:MAG: terpene cyclase/mutase family protein, partial [Planctomycetaceae bacterium]|nr:terpene cyclase/mutase family protein [Planctomycetaceae bacterium]